jgi:hypothetical protein
MEDKPMAALNFSGSNLLILKVGGKVLPNRMRLELSVRVIINFYLI